MPVLVEGTEKDGFVPREHSCGFEHCDDSSYQNYVSNIFSYNEGVVCWCLMAEPCNHKGYSKGKKNNANLL